MRNSRTTAARWRDSCMFGSAGPLVSAWPSTSTRSDGSARSAAASACSDSKPSAVTLDELEPKYAVSPTGASALESAAAASAASAAKASEPNRFIGSPVHPPELHAAIVRMLLRGPVLVGQAGLAVALRHQAARID